MRPTLLAGALALAAATALAPAAPAAAQAPTTIWLVRHAETAPDGTDDPPLSERGRERADRLAAMLAGAGLDAVHTTPYRRTRETAGAVARAAGLEAATYDPRDLEGFARRLRDAGGTHLVVGHSNTTPALVRLLGGDPVSPIAEDDHGRVYQVRVAAGGEGCSALLGYPGAGAAAAASPPAPPAADPADVGSIDAIVAALYDVISGPVGEARDWDRLRSLFLPTARMIPVQHGPQGVVHRALTVEDYIRGSGPMLEQIGFTEREVARTVDRFAEVAQVFSTYEGVRQDTGETVAEGINSIQLIFDGTRWWISSLAWSPERPDLPVPPRYRAPGGERGAAAPASATGLVEAMRARYPDWYRTLSFRQRVIRTPPEGPAPPVEVWYERIASPGRLRIDFGHDPSGSGAIYAGDSVFVFQDGRAVRREADRNPLLLLGFDVYRQPARTTLEQLRDEGFDLSRFHEATYRGRPAYVVGAEPGDRTSPQFWIDAERLVFLRLITPAGPGGQAVSEITFEDYEPLAGGWIAPLVVFRVDGRETMREEYFDVVANPEIAPGTFDPRAWPGGR